MNRRPFSLNRACAPRRDRPAPLSCLFFLSIEDTTQSQPEIQSLSQLIPTYDAPRLPVVVNVYLFVQAIQIILFSPFFRVAELQEGLLRDEFPSSQISAKSRISDVNAQAWIAEPLVLHECPIVMTGLRVRSGGDIKALSCRNGLEFLQSFLFFWSEMSEMACQTSLHRRGFCWRRPLLLCRGQPGQLLSSHGGAAAIAVLTRFQAQKPPREAGGEGRKGDGF